MTKTCVNNDEDIQKKPKSGIFSYLNSTLYKHKIGELLVIHGYISPLELRHALKIQKATNKPLGQIVVELNLINKYQLMTLLTGQRVLRLAAASMLYFCSLGISKKSHAEPIKDIPAKVLLASAGNMHFSKMNRYPSLFGANEKRSENLKAFTKWSDMFIRFEREMLRPSQNKVIIDLKAELAAYQSDSIHEMAAKVNAMMNKQKYIVDSQNWGKSDYWATPIEFLTRGGDCEDFAIAKYVALRALGVPEERMRIAIVQDMKKNIPHAILIVYSEHGAQVLDNQIKELRSASAISHYKPIFSINRTAWWLHTKPVKTNTIVASAE